MMTVLKETTGQTAACDGCGRTDAGPGQPLHITAYVVNDPNIGGAVTHHYCGGCAANRGLVDPAVSIAGWEAVPIGEPVTEMPATEAPAPAQ